MNQNQISPDPNHPQFHTTRPATESEIETKRQSFLQAKDKLITTLNKLKSALDTDQPVQGDKRLVVKELTEQIKADFDHFDTRSYEYFEVQEVGVIEKKKKKNG